MAGVLKPSPGALRIIDDLEGGLAIVVNGDTAPKNIAAGQYLFIKNHSTLATGGYHATAAISSGGTISSSNVTADADGIANSLNSKIATQSVTVAKANANYTYGNVTFEKTANYVRVMIEGFVSLPAQGYTDICAIPTGFAPSAQKFFDVIAGTNETGANLRTIRFRITGTTLSAYNYGTELSNVNSQPIIMYIR